MKVYLNGLQLIANQCIGNYCEFQFCLIFRRLMKRNQGFVLSRQAILSQILQTSAT